MRTPAALIAGAIVPVGLTAAPKIEEGDSGTCSDANAYAIRHLPVLPFCFRLLSPAGVIAI
eukprot:891929-Rhodomonas_salina.1